MCPYGSVQPGAQLVAKSVGSDLRGELEYQNLIQITLTSSLARFVYIAIHIACLHFITFSRLALFPCMHTGLYC
jgi:hypothetical protein